MDVADELKPIMKKNTEELMLSKDVVYEKQDGFSKTVKDLEELKVVKVVKDYKPLNVVESIIMDGDELKLVKVIEEVKSKIGEFESKLNEVRFSVYVVSIP